MRNIALRGAKGKTVVLKVTDQTQLGKRAPNRNTALQVKYLTAVMNPSSVEVLQIPTKVAFRGQAPFVKGCIVCFGYVKRQPDANGGPLRMSTSLTFQLHSSRETMPIASVKPYTNENKKEKVTRHKELYALARYCKQQKGKRIDPPRGRTWNLLIRSQTLCH